MEPGPLAAHDMTEPGELARRDERQRLVGRLEDLTAFVEHVAPGGLVAGDARVQHEVVVPAGDRDRVELDRPELPEDLEHPVEASRERPRRREEVPRDEKATRRLSSDLHPQDTSRVSREPACYKQREEIVPAVTSLTLQLLAWIAERDRTYAQTMEAWKSSCPRLTVWEDAVADGLVRIQRGNVLLTAAGTELLSMQPVT